MMMIIIAHFRCDYPEAITHHTHNKQKYLKTQTYKDKGICDDIVQ